MSAERVFTFDEAATHLKIVTVHWLKKQVRAGKIECTRLGRKVVFTESQVAKILADSVQPAREARPRKQRTPKPVQQRPKPVRLEPLAGIATEPLVFDRSRSRNYRAGGAA